LTPSHSTRFPLVRYWGFMNHRITCFLLVAGSSVVTACADNANDVAHYGSSAQPSGGASANGGTGRNQGGATDGGATSGGLGQGGNSGNGGSTGLGRGGAGQGGSSPNGGAAGSVVANGGSTIGSAGSSSGGTIGTQVRCGVAAICKTNESCCGPQACGICAPSGTAPSACPTTCSGAGGAGGAGQCLTDGSGRYWSFPQLVRTCVSDSDCILVHMAIECCGTEGVSSYRRDQLPNFEPIAAACNALVQCECMIGAPRTDSGATLGNITDARAECLNGTCTAVAPPS
jgi:hypothetical protein